MKLQENISEVNFHLNGEISATFLTVKKVAAILRGSKQHFVVGVKYNRCRKSKTHFDISKKSSSQL